MMRKKLIPFLLCGPVLAIACGKTTPMDTMDLAPAADLSVQIDMATPADMTTPPDMAQFTCQGVNGTTHEVSVGMPSNRFSPDTLTIKQCDTVKWVWKAGTHNVVSGDGTPDNKFCSDAQTPGMCSTSQTKPTPNTFEFKFVNKGAYPYYCKPHLGAGMKGTITVN